LELKARRVGSLSKWGGEAIQVGKVSHRWCGFIESGAIDADVICSTAPALAKAIKSEDKFTSRDSNFDSRSYSSVVSASLDVGCQPANAFDKVSSDSHGSLSPLRRPNDVAPSV